MSSEGDFLACISGLRCDMYSQNNELQRIPDVLLATSAMHWASVLASGLWDLPKHGEDGGLPEKAFDLINSLDAIGEYLNRGDTIAVLATLREEHPYASALAVVTSAVVERRGTEWALALAETMHGVAGLNTREEFGHVLYLAYCVRTYSVLKKLRATLAGLEKADKHKLILEDALPEIARTSDMCAEVWQSRRAIVANPWVANSLDFELKVCALAVDFAEEWHRNVSSHAALFAKVLGESAVTGLAW